MNTGDLIGLLIVVAIPMLFLGYMGKRYFAYRERRLDAETGMAAEKAAQYATSNAELEHRLRVVEQIVTDRGIDTAAQIEALRAPRLTREPVQS